MKETPVRIVITAMGSTEMLKSVVSDESDLLLLLRRHPGKGVSVSGCTASRMMPGTMTPELARFIMEELYEAAERTVNQEGK